MKPAAGNRGQLWHPRMGQAWGCPDGASSYLPASSHHSGLKYPYPWAAGGIGSHAAWPALGLGELWEKGSPEFFDVSIPVLGRGPSTGRKVPALRGRRACLPIIQARSAQGRRAPENLSPAQPGA